MNNYKSCYLDLLIFDMSAQPQQGAGTVMPNFNSEIECIDHYTAQESRDVVIY
jgi:hypothetical protein